VGSRRGPRSVLPAVSEKYDEVGGGGEGFEEPITGGRSSQGRPRLRTGPGQAMDPVGRQLAPKPFPIDEPDYVDVSYEYFPPMEQPVRGPAPAVETRTVSRNATRREPENHIVADARDAKLLNEVQQMSRAIQQENNETRRELNELRQSVLDLASNYSKESKPSNNQQQKALSPAAPKSSTRPKVDNWVPESQPVPDAVSIRRPPSGKKDTEDLDESLPMQTLDQRLMDYARQRGLFTGNKNKIPAEPVTNSRRGRDALDQSLQSERYLSESVSSVSRSFQIFTLIYFQSVCIPGWTNNDYSEA
jgi:hypothetical protein